jgi:hypothetical protein
MIKWFIEMGEVIMRSILISSVRALKIDEALLLLRLHVHAVRVTPLNCLMRISCLFGAARRESFVFGTILIWLIALFLWKYRWFS